MLSQKHAIDFPCEKIALELGLALSLALLVRAMPARPALRFLLTTYPHLFKTSKPLIGEELRGSLPAGRQGSNLRVHL